MATLHELNAADALHLVDDANWNFVSERSIYASPRLMDWLSGPLADMPYQLELSPLEQVSVLFEDFCSGEPLKVGAHFSALDAIRGTSLWKLKTAEVRIFGWFAQRDVFVGVSGFDADHVKRHGLYHGIAGDVARFRDQLDLDEPKFVDGDQPYGVVSNYSFP